MLAKNEITGLILAGGHGSRMGGVDKGLLLFDGQELALRAALRMREQVHSVWISANRHQDSYAQWGFHVVSDSDCEALTLHEVPAAMDAGMVTENKATRLSNQIPNTPQFAGPLAGICAALQQCKTPYLVSAPCDTPFFPTDFVRTLVHGLGKGSSLAAYAACTEQDGQLRLHPVFCLLHKKLQPQLANYLNSGGRKVMDWMRMCQAQQIVFEQDASGDAFTNLNSDKDWERLRFNLASKPP